MKSVFSLFLAVLLLACPQFCRAESLGCCADHCEETQGDSQTPDPVQNEAVSCICAGAVRDSDSQLGAKVGLGDCSPLSFPPVCLLPPLRMLSSAAGSIEPPERVVFGPIRIHLLLQNLRC